NRTLRRHSVRATASRRLAFRRNARKRTHSTHMEAEPMGVENLVESVPIGMRRAEQRSERGPQRGRSPCNGVREDRECITRFPESDLESVVAQRARKARKPFAHRPPDFFNGRT